MYYNVHAHRLHTKGNLEVKTVLNIFPQDFISKKGESETNYFSCGIHPWYAKEIEDNFDLLENTAKDDAVVAIGEVGLDKLQGAAIDVQLGVFKVQMQLAEKVQKPLIIHCVKAWDELIALRKESKTSIPWILHGYRGNPEQTKQLYKQGFMFSIGEKFNEESVKQIPLNSIFCETDESEKTICQIYEKLSDCLGVEKDYFAYMVAENISKNIVLLTK